MDDDDNVHESEDDALEDTRADDYFDPDTDEEKLDEDNNPPGAPASISGVAPDDPALDDGLDEDEVYSEGIAAAADRDDFEEDSDDQPPQPLEPEE